ncbi:MAG: sulfoxide reductase heme-binding subunit YedZ [Caldilineaceae bacterium]|nr:sulfoxide reductase heme-binding subunit YedZ [Caldilineaceae bacterium]
MSSIRSYVRENWLWLLANIGSMVPLLWLLWDQWQDNLSINPIADYTDRTGSTAIILLLLSLAVTPVQTVTGWRKVSTVRKSLGLWAFAYAVLHMLVFVGLDYGFSLRFILLDGLPSKPYIVVGLSALLILLPLALTSTKGMQKRLGKNWKKLHRWVYAAGLLAVIHYLWVAKVAFGEPTLYTVILVLLLAARLPTIRSWLSKLRPKRTVRPAPAARKRPKVAAEVADM